MTRIDFYQLDSGRHSSDRIVCQLCHKAYESKQLTLLLTQSPEQSSHLDRHLWLFEDDSFIPHDAQDSIEFLTPILIHDEPEPKGDRQLLINLKTTIPDYFAQFERVIELVTDDNKTAAREHYNFYRERGYTIDHHTL